jgi:hypothetical protein
MAENNDLNELWNESPQDSQPFSPPSQEPAVQQGPSLESLARDLEHIKGAVYGIMSRFNQPTQPASTESTTKSESDTFPTWQEKEFLTPADVQAMLDTQQPHVAFNRAINAAVKEVYDRFAERYRDLDKNIKTFTAQQMQAQAASEAEARAQKVRQDFYEKYPDLKDVQDLVQVEAMKLASSFQPNMNFMTAEQIMDMVANNTRARLSALRGGGDGVQKSTVSSQARRPAPYMEKGGAPRSQPGQGKPKPGTQEFFIDELDRYVRG